METTTNEDDGADAADGLARLTSREVHRQVRQFEDRKQWTQAALSDELLTVIV